MAETITATRITTAALAATLIAATTMPTVADPTKTFSKHAKGSSTVVDHGAWDKLLKTYVVASPDGLNRVRYKAFKSGGTLR